MCNRQHVLAFAIFFFWKWLVLCYIFYSSIANEFVKNAYKMYEIESKKKIVAMHLASIMKSKI